MDPVSGEQVDPKMLRYRNIEVLQHIAVDGAVHIGRLNVCVVCNPPSVEAEAKAAGGSFVLSTNATNATNAVNAVNATNAPTRSKIPDLRKPEATQQDSRAQQQSSAKDDAAQVDWINPAHYRRGPTVDGKAVECIQIVRGISDFRLANAMKYIWRVAFGGKLDNKEDISKAVWYLSDYINFPPEERR